MKTQTAHARAAKAIRYLLQSKYPGIKFSVTSRSYAGGNSVHIDYEDGPTYTEVNDLVSVYQEGNFNGMEDIYEYKRDDSDLPRVKYVQVQRDMSHTAQARFLKVVTEKWDNLKFATLDSYDIRDYCVPAGEWVSVLVRREFAKEDLTQKGEVAQ